MDRLVLSMLCITLSANALAGGADIVASDNEVGIQFISTYVDYSETGNGLLGTDRGTLDTEDGSVPGAAAFLSLMLGAHNLYLQASYDHSRLYTGYTGSLQGGHFGSVVATSGAALTNYSARLGKGFAIDDQFMLTPYVEAGRHRWDRGINDGEIYTHEYSGLGVLAQYSPAGESRAVLSAQFLIGSTHASYIVVMPGTGNAGFSGALGNSRLERFGVAADYALTRRVHLGAGIEHTSFQYGMSAVYPAGGGLMAWEPDSKTHYTTYRLGLGFAL